MRSDQSHLPQPEAMTDPVAQERAAIVDRLRVGDLCLEMHPSHDGQHKRADIARQIVGNFHSKADLVQVVNVLLALGDHHAK